MPPVLWWLFGTVAACFLILWSTGGLSRTLWWFGLLLGSTAVAVVTLWMRDSLEDGSGLHSLADAVTRLFWLVAALLFLFGILVAGNVVLGRVLSAFTGSARYSEDGPENWRR